MARKMAEGACSRRSRRPPLPLADPAYLATIVLDVLHGGADPDVRAVVVHRGAVVNRARGSGYSGESRAAHHPRKNEGERDAPRRPAQDRAHGVLSRPCGAFAPTGRVGLATHSPSDLGDRLSPCPSRTLPAGVGGGRSDHRVPCRLRLPTTSVASASPGSPLRDLNGW